MKRLEMNEVDGPVIVTISDLYLEDLTFDSRPRESLPWLMVCMVL
jgi:hypothetical protein